MEDELDQGSGVGASESPSSDNLHSETLFENMGSENPVNDSFEEGDDGEEIMVEIVGSDVFVDGVSGNEEGDFRSAEIGDLDGHVSEKKEKESIDVSSEGGENKIGKSESGLPESMDERNYDFTGENKTGENELGLPESKDEKRYVVSEAMDVSSEGGENKIGESESGLKDERNYVFTGENKTGESELGLPESKDEKSYVVSEAMDVSSEGVENKIGVPESKDERNYVFTGENKTGESELGLPESKDEKSYVVTEAMDVSSEGVENKIGVPESKDERNYVFTGENKTGKSELSKDEKSYVISEAMGVSSEGGEKQVGERESGLPESRDESYLDVTEAIDVSGEGGESKTGESESGLPESRDERNYVFTDENKMGESELGLHESRDEKNHLVTEAMDVSSEGGEIKMGKSESGSPESRDEKIHVVTEETDVGFSEPVNVEVGISSMQNEEAMVTTRTVIIEEKTGKDEAVDEKAGVEEKEDHLVSVSVTSLGMTKDKDSNDDQILTSDVSVNPNGEGSENVRIDRIDIVTTQMDVREEEETIKDEAVDEKEDVLPLSDDALNRSVMTCHGTTKSSHDGQIVPSEVVLNPNEKEGLAAENKDLIVKSNALASDVQNENESRVNDSHGTKFESDNEKSLASEKEETVVEEFDVVLDFNDDESLKSDGNFDVVSNEPTQAVEIEADKIENQPNQPFNAICQVDVVGGGGLSENVDEIVSRESLECEENAEMRNDIEVVSVAEVSDITQVSVLPEIAEKSEMPFDGTNVSLLDGGEIDEKNKSGEEKGESDGNYHDAMEIDSESGNEGLTSGAHTSKSSNEERNRMGYFSNPENEGSFAISDLVWGKVRSHPWWPGQIFDPADASEKAVKHYKKDSYLVAYFGDRTFAWNDSSLLKHFGPHFSLIIEKQSNSEGFQDAVNSALEEVSRRVELGLACSCIPKDKYAAIEAQIVENAGVREESSKRYGVDRSTRASYFEPDKLIEYVKDFAPRVVSGPDRLDLVIARAQLSAFYRFKGYRPPTIFPSPGELLETDAEKISNDEIIVSNKRNIPEDISESRKERSMTELMDDDESFGKERKALDPLMDGYDKRVSIYAAKVSTSTSQAPPNKPSFFKIGECIRRVASQLTGSASSGKDEMVIDEHPERRSVVISVESFSVEEMLSQLERVARGPKRRHDFINVIHTFFMGFRSSIALNRRWRKKRAEQTGGGPAEEFEFDDDANDSYWTDRIVQNYSDERLLSNRENGPGNHQLLPEKPVKPGRRPHSRKRFSDRTGPDELDERVKRRKHESLPAELILSFSERNSIPSEIKLNKMFRRFGPLMESETEVDFESGCAKVIFKRASDAEVARDSSEKFNIFGPGLVNYQIGYEPLISVKVLPLLMPRPHEDAILMQ